MGEIRFPEEMLKNMWEEFDWNKAERKILKKQKLLSIATFKHRDEDIKKLSIEILSSVEAKALAVRRVSEELDSAPGIDGVRWIKSSEKMEATLLLNPKDYKAKPFKRFVVRDEKSDKERRISIPSMFDRAMQVLYMMALEPIAEAQADRKSFAFRKGRSAFDVHALIMHLLTEKDAPEWFLICDVKSYYDTISHKWLLNNIPMDKRVLRQFIKAGIVFNNEVFPTDVGISLGCNISTIIGNMTLDGIQHLLYDQQDPNNMDYWEGYAIRFADDIIISSRSKEKANEYLKLITDFVNERGLQLSPTKTHIANINDGFDFLSRHYYKANGNVYCTPSEKSIIKLENELYELIMNSKKRWSQLGLIRAINSKLNGWASYHRITESYQAFKRIDVVVSSLLLNLMKKMHPKLSVKVIIKKYWYKDVKGREIFTLTTNKTIQVIKLEDVVLVTHKRLDIKQNVFLDEEYFRDRTSYQEILKVSGRYKKVWERQNGKCYYCGKPINQDQPRKIIFKKLSNDTTIRNMAYIHSFCSDDEIVYVNSDITDSESLNVKSILKSIEDPYIMKIKTENSKYKKLYEYFANCRKQTFLIKFSELEDIIGCKLCKSLYEYESYWYQKRQGVISNCWLDNGYTIKKLNLKEKKVTFIRKKKELSKIKIPEEILSSKLPADAKYEIEQHFDYIIKKYGLYKK